MNRNYLVQGGLVLVLLVIWLAVIFGDVLNTQYGIPILVMVMGVLMGVSEYTGEDTNYLVVLAWVLSIPFGALNLLYEYFGSYYWYILSWFVFGVVIVIALYDIFISAEYLEYIKSYVQS